MKLSPALLSFKAARAVLVLAAPSLLGPEIFAQTCAPAPSGLVSWWPGNGNALDSIGGNNGTLHGNGSPIGMVTYAPGEVGQAFSFNTNMQAVVIGNPANLQLQEFTIDAWIQLSSPNVFHFLGMGIFGYGAGGYLFGMTTNFQLSLAQVGGGEVDSTNQIVDANWHHVAVTKSRSNTVFYIDGQPNPPLISTNLNFQFNTSAAIGAQGGDFSDTFLGLIDEIDVFNRALSAAEIQTIYNASAAGKCSIATAPNILTQPASLTAFQGLEANFSVVANGSPPLQYQWQLNGTNVSGATNAVLNLINVQTTNAGNYSMVVTNLFGSITSSNAVLTVNPANCAPTPSGLVGWWPGDGNPNDLANGDNGILQGGVTYAAGSVGQAFSFNGTGQGVLVGNPANLQLQDFTIEAWIQRGSSTYASADPSGGAIFGYGNGGYLLGLSDNGEIFLTSIGTTVTARFMIADTVWHHLAITKVGTTVVFYVDGIAYSAPAFGVTFQFTTPAAIGARGDTLGNSFFGLIDEVSLYNRALTAVELLGIYDAGHAGKCRNTAPPSVTSQPANQTVTAGHNLTFQVVVSGAEPLGYQWLFNGTNLASATGSTLDISAQFATAGNYSVVISNLYGSIASSNALLTVTAAICDQVTAGLVGWWPGDGNATNLANGDSGTLQGGASYAPGIVGRAFSFDGNNQGVTVGNPVKLQLQDFTIEAWIQRGSLTQVSSDPGGGAIFGYGSGGYLLGLTDSGQMFLTQIGTSVSPTVQITDTDWHHVAVTKVGTAVVFYVDGIAYSAPAYNVNFQFSTPAAIGARGDNLANSFLGLIDEVSIYNRTLTAAEVLAIYNAAGAGKCGKTGPPSITSQPASQTLAPGLFLTLQVAATGAYPLSYHWFFNGTTLPGATGSSLAFNVQPANAGSYSATIANAYGSITSSNAVLTVSPAMCAPAPSGLVSWWPGNGSAFDSVGGNNGTLQGNGSPQGVVAYAQGEVGQAFNFKTNMEAVVIGNLPNLQLQDFTIDAWIQLSSSNLFPFIGGMGIFGYGAGGYLFGLTANGQLSLAEVGCCELESTNQILDAYWHHVAVSKSSSNVVFYVDGQPNPPLMSTNLMFQFNTPVAIGAQGDEFLDTFLGSIDEVDVFNRPLSAAEIQAIYNAGSAGKCPVTIPPSINLQPAGESVVQGVGASLSVVAAGSPPLNYQWRLNGTNLNGATGDVLTWGSVQPANAGNYSVTITNAYGSITSSNALLTMIPAICDPAPAGLVGWWPGDGNANDIASGNNGVLELGVTFAAGEVGQAFSFDGNVQGVSVGNPASLQLQDFTIEAWVQRTSVTQTAIVAPGDGVIFGYGAGGYALGLSHNGQLSLGQPGATSSVSASSMITNTNWHHLAVTKVGTTVVFYVDGIAYSAPPFDVTFSFTTPAGIGSLAGTFYYNFLGLIDEVSVYNRALTASEIQGIYNAASAGKCRSTTPPFITTQPASQAVYEGRNSILQVVAGGAEPLGYQWFLNGTKLPGATGSMLTLTDVQATNAGDYFVSITNAYGSITSSNAVLTLIPVVCDSAPAGLVGWWPGEGNPNDIADGDNGVLQGGVTYVPGEVGQAFSFNGSGQAVSVGNPTSLQLQDFTIEAWIQRTSLTQASSDFGGGIIFGYGAGGYLLWLSNNSQIFLTQLAASVGPSVLIIDTNWHHLAVTKMGTAVVFYLDGFSYPAPPYNVNFQFTTPAAIGARGDTFGNSFLGLIDEVSIYSRALTALEIKGIYNAGPGGKCPITASPSIISQPTNQTLYAGGNLTFQVAAVGAYPLSYQWLRNGTNLPGATGPVLALTNVQSANAGGYSVTITNAYGSTTSSNALLTVNPVMCDPVPAGLAGWWPGDGSADDLANGDNGVFQGGVTYAPGEVGQAFSFGGSGQAVSVGNPASLQLQDFTIEAWIQRSSLSQASPDPGGGIIFGYGNGGYLLGLNNSGVLFLTQIGPSVSSSAQIVDANWHHVAVTKVGASVIFYVDGVAYSAAAFGVSFQFATPAAIGARGDNLANSFLGLIDELSIYSRALTPSEIQGIYDARSDGKCKQVVPPTVTIQPVAQVVTVGNSTVLSVGAIGSFPLSYQWRFNGAYLAGATASTLILTNLQLSDAGVYSVNVSNPQGTIVSSNALLTVSPPVCVAPPSGLVAWWPGQGNTTNVIDGDPGTLQGNVGFFGGEVGRAFGFDGNGEGIIVGNLAVLQLQDFTIEAWIQRGSSALASFDPSGSGTIFGYGNAGYLFGLNNAGQISLTQVGSTSVSPGVSITDIVWHHMAVTKVGTTVMFYVDGIAYPAPAFGASFQFTTPAAIGAQGDTFGSSFLGLIDELSIYNRALAPAEIQGVYNAGGAGKCPGAASPFITVPPVNQTVVAGSNVTFSVNVTGSPPLNYQWQLNGANLNEATSAVLILTNVQPANIGDYSVVVTNPYGSTISSNALLTLAPGACAPIPSGLVGWWPGDGNTGDLASGDDGVLQGGVTYAPGIVGRAFNFDGPGQAVSVGNPPNLHLQNFTIEAWIQRGSALLATLEFDSSGDIFGYGIGGYLLGLNNNGQIFLKQSGNTSVSPSALILDTVWHHLAVTKAGSNVIFYLDGFAFPTPAFSANFEFNTPAAIGALGGSFDSSFLGLIDEVSVYSRALTAGEIQGIYQAGSGGKCPGAAPPSIISQPTNQILFAGQNLTLQVQVGGAEPKSYQWLLNRTNILGATNFILTLFDVQPTNAGSYELAVTNAYGSITTSNVFLTVIPAICDPAPAGLVGWWPGDGNTNDLANGDNGVLQGGVTYAAGEVGQAFSFTASGQGVSVGNPTGLQLQDFTIEAWIKRASLTQASFDAGGGAIFGYGNGGYLLGLSDSGQMYLTQIGVSVSSSAQIIDSSWHHVAVAKVGTSVVFYVDGVAFPAPAFNVSFQFATPAAIGARGDTFGNSFLGLIDEVSIYSRALTAAEIQGIFDAGSDGKCKQYVPVSIITQPSAQVVTVGNSTLLSVVAKGSNPISYQWLLNGTNLAGATNSMLVLTNLQLGEAGEYSVNVSDPNASIVSSNALLTVNPPVCTAPPSGLVAWWPGEGNSTNVIDGDPETLQGNVSFVGGKVGRAFSFNGNGQAVIVGNPAFLQLQDFTIEAWIQRGSSTLASFDPGGSGTIFGYGNAGYLLGLNNAGQIFLGQVGSNSVSPGVSIADTAWHYLAVTKVRTAVVFYVDGIAYPAPAFDTNPPSQGTGVGPDSGGSNGSDDGSITTIDVGTGGGTVPILPAIGKLSPVVPSRISKQDLKFTTPAAIGAQGDTFGSSFLGLIDELSIYNRALAPAEVQAIYNAGGAGKCPGAVSPLISVPPTNQTVVAGSIATFSVDASGSSPVHFIWEFNGKILTDETNVSLTLLDVQKTNAGVYQIVATNAYGAVTSSPVTLTVDLPPSIVSEPGSQTVPVGGAALFFADATGDAPLAYQWQFNGANLVGATNYWMSLTNVQAGNSGQYEVLVTNVAGAITSAPAVLAVVFSPSITTEPQSQTGYVGANSYFTVGAAAVGSTNLGYQWRFNGTNLSGATSSSLVLDNVQSNSAGDYSVVVSNAAGSVTSSNALLTVRGSACASPPSGLVGWWQGEDSPDDAISGAAGIVIGNAGYVAGEAGRAFNFLTNGDAILLGNPLQLQLQDFTIDAWVKRAGTNGVSSDQSGNGEIFGYGAGGYAFSLTDSGQVMLSAVGVGGVGSTRRITDLAWHHLAVAKSATNVVFYLDGAADPPSGFTGVFQFTTQAAIGARSDTLSNSFLGAIDEVDVFNQALPASEVQSIYDATTLGKCAIPISISAQMTNQSVIVGSNATLVVSVTGSGPIQYQWLFNGSAIHGATNSTFSLGDATLLQSGAYVVAVSNPLGTILSSKILLKVEPPSLLVNGGFETGDFTGWIVNDIELPLYPLMVRTFGFDPGFGFFASAPSEGNYAATDGFEGDGPGAIRLAQDVVLTNRPAQLTFDYRAAWDMKTFAGSTRPRTFAVILEPYGGGAAFQTFPLLTAAPGTVNPDSGSLSGLIDLSAYSGESLRISFEQAVPESFTGPGFFQLDNVVLSYIGLPALVISQTAGKVVLSWPTGASTPAATLEWSPNLKSWSAVASDLLNIGATNTVATLPMVTGPMFYRLKYP